MDDSQDIDVFFPPKLQVLWQPARYIVLYGGRGGAKSWGVARTLLAKGTQKPISWLCARELQKSIKDSVHRLLAKQIEKMGLSSFYNVQVDSINGINGTQFRFEGIKNNTEAVKSFESFDGCWLEEADNVSAESMEILIPTFRKEGSQFIITFNPDQEEDFIYQNFVVNPPPRVLNGRLWCLVQKIGWQDNPWLSEELRMEKDALKAKDIDRYLHVWEGQCKQVLEGAIYAEELRALALEGRITKVPVDHSIPVDTFWDLGRADHTSIWFAQYLNYEYHILDYYENNLKHIDHYLGVLQSKGYVYGTAWLPHDAKAKTLGTKKSIEEQVRARFPKTRIVPKLSIADGINAVRTIFPNCYFDDANTVLGRKRLRNYHYEKVAGKQTYSATPCHDENSNGADAFRMLGVAMGEPKRGQSAGFAKKVNEEMILRLRKLDESVGLGWMGK